jgi:hypothetical protein
MRSAVAFPLRKNSRQIPYIIRESVTIYIKLITIAGDGNLLSTVIQGDDYGASVIDCRFPGEFYRYLLRFCLILPETLLQ